MVQFCQKIAYIFVITYQYSGNRIDNNIKPFNDLIMEPRKKPPVYLLPEIDNGVTIKVRNSIFSLKGVFFIMQKNSRI